MQFNATRWYQRSAEAPYAPEPLDFDHVLDLGVDPNPLIDAYTVDSEFQLWSDFIQVPTDAGVDLADAAPRAGVASDARGEEFDNTGSQYAYTE